MTSSARSCRVLGAGHLEVRVFMDYLGGRSQRVKYNESLSSHEGVKLKLESTARAVVGYMAVNYMALNPDKTQILWAGSRPSSMPVIIGNSTVSPVDTLDFLGIKFD